MSLINDGFVKRGTELLDGAVPIVYPDFDEVHLFGGELPDGLPAVFLGGHAIRHTTHRLGAGTGIRRCQASAGRAEESAGMWLVPQLIRQVAWIRASAHDKSDAVVRVAVQVIHHVLTRVVLGRVSQSFLKPNVTVKIDECGHDGLAGQVHARRTRRDLDFSLLADARDRVLFNQECAVLDWRPAVAHDDPRTFEQERCSWRPGRLLSRMQGKNSKQKQPTERCLYCQHSLSLRAEIHMRTRVFFGERYTVMTSAVKHRNPANLVIRQAESM